MCLQSKNQGIKCIRFKISTNHITHIVKIRSLFSRDFVHIKLLYMLENQSKIYQGKKKNSGWKGWKIFVTITPSVTQQVLKVENGKCFGRVLHSFLKCLLMVVIRDKTVG